MTIQLEAEPAVRRDRWGRYVVVPPEGGKPTGYQRATTLAKVLEDTSNLMDWACRMTLLGAAQRPDILAAAQTTSPDDRKALNAIVERAKDAGGATIRRDLGTALHKMVENSHADPAYVVPEQYRADVEAVNAAIDAAGFDVVTEFSEKILVLDVIQVAGMCDLVLRRRSDGQLFIADLKTGASVNYGALGWSIQLSCYAHADNIYVQGPAKDGSEDQRLPAPAVDRTTGLIFHVQPGSGTCDIHALELSERRLELAVAVRTERKRRGLLVPFTIEGGGAAGTARQDVATTPVTSVEPTPPRAPDQPAAVVPCPAAAGDPVPVAGALDAVLHQTRVAWVMNRIVALVVNPAAAPWLGQLWPATVPRPKETPGGPGAWTADQLAAVVGCVDQVEAQVQAPFGDPDPAVAAAQRAELDRRAEAATPVVHRLTAPEDGPVLAEPTDVDWQRQVMRHMTVEQQAEVLQWIRDAQSAGVPWAMSPAGQPTPLRRLEIARAALELAQLDGHTPGDDTGPRAALTLVIGEDAQQPVHRVGALLGTLTTEQAGQLAAVCETHRLVAADGAVRLEAVA